MDNNSLFIFLHIPKCAGTTFVKHIKKNFSEEEAIDIDKVTLSLLKGNSKHRDYLSKVNKYFSNFSESRKNKVKVIYGHTVPWGVHKNFNKKAEYFTFLRDPSRRTESLYNYYCTLYYNADKKDRKKEFFKLRLLLNGKAPSFATWVAKKYGNKDSYFSVKTLYQYFETLGYIIGSEDNLDSIFKKFYFVGFTEKFDTASLFVFYELGINKFFIKQNISKNYLDKKSRKKAKNTLLAKNGKDRLIFEKAKAFNKSFRRGNKDFYKKVEKVKIRRKISLPFTQLIFDFKESLHRFSAYLRTQSKIYGATVDKIKGRDV